MYEKVMEIYWKLYFKNFEVLLIQDIYILFFSINLFLIFSLCGFKSFLKILTFAFINPALRYGINIYI